MRVAELVGRDKGTVSRTLATLSEAGLVSRDPTTNLYRLGFQLYALAARTVEARLVQISLPYLRRVVAATHETTHLCVLRGGNVLTLASELCEHQFRGLGWQGVSTAAWQTSSGRVLISDWAEKDLMAWYEEHGHDSPVTGGGYEPATSAGTIGSPPGGTPKVTDFASLKAEIRKIRAAGYATVDEEFESGVVGVSAPIMDFRKNIIAVINISAPTDRLRSHLNEAGQFAAKVAAELSAQLGA